MLSTVEYPLSLAPFELPSTTPVRLAKPKPRAAKSIRIFIADDQTLFRDGLRSFLHKSPAFKVVGEAGSEDDIVKRTVQLRPDILLLDISSPRMNGFHILRQVQKSASGIHVIVLSGELLQSQMLDAMKGGARGFVLKTSPSSVLVEAIRKVAEGQYWVMPENLPALIQAATDDSPRRESNRNRYGLTRRENEILSTVLDGYSNPEIAEKFGLSEQTIKHHLSHIFDKLGVYSRLELALFAVSHKLIDGDS